VPQPPAAADDTGGKCVLFLLLGESGRQVYSHFAGLMDSFPAGFHQERQHVLWIKEDGGATLPESARTHTLAIHEGEIPQRRFQTMLGDFFRMVRTLGPNTPARIVLAGSLADPLTKYLPDVCLNLRQVGDRMPIDRDLFLHLPADDLSAISPRQQYGLLREIFFMAQAAMRPLPDNDWDQDKWLDHLFVFENDPGEADADLYRRIAYSLFLFLHPRYPILAAGTPAAPGDEVQLLRANFAGLPVTQLLDYFACRIARQLLFDPGGVLSIDPLSQPDVNKLWAEVDKSQALVALRAGTFARGLTLTEQALNNSADAERWKKLAILQLALQWPPNNLTEFAEKCRALQLRLQAMQNAALRRLQESTADPLYRWNVSSQQTAAVAERLFGEVLGVHMERLLGALDANVGVHLECHPQRKEFQFGVVCVPAQIEGEFFLHDHTFALESAGEEERLADALLALVRAALHSLLRDQDWSVSLSPLRQEDTRFLQKAVTPAARVARNNLPLGGMLISPRYVPLDPAVIFPGFADVRRVESQEQPFAAAAGILLNFPAARVARLNELHSRYVPQADNQQRQPQLQNAAYFEAQYYQLTRNRDWLIEGSLLETMFERRAVILFFQALDRQHITWSDQQGWEMEKLGNYAPITLTPKTSGITAARPEKDLDSLFAAYYGFTLGIPSTLDAGTFQHPLNPVNRASYFEYLKQKFSAAATTTQRVAQFRWVESQLKAQSDPRFIGLHHLYLVSRNTTNF
jgi:hypothetical protein